MTMHGVPAGAHAAEEAGAAREAPCGSGTHPQAGYGMDQHEAAVQECAAHGACMARLPWQTSQR